ncbi:Cytochrome c oxidase assembly factor 3 [Trichinella spiralis]|uniref:Cytochrome c oxidase assembly factor 3 n=1 Tax=Trichinella spiralis TaxID=6334 RepID=A0ABR3K7R8_TRISP
MGDQDTVVTCMPAHQLAFRDLQVERSTYSLAHKSINSSSAFADMPVPTTSACCEKPDKNSDSQAINTESKFNCSPNNFR